MKRFVAAVLVMAGLVTVTDDATLGCSTRFTPALNSLLYLQRAQLRAGRQGTRAILMHRDAGAFAAEEATGTLEVETSKGDVSSVQFDLRFTDGSALVGEVATTVCPRGSTTEFSVE